MATLPITALYTAALGALFLLLSIRTIRQRRRAQVAVGDGADPGLARAMRAHANFAEYVPLTLLLMLFVESGGAAGVWVHLLGLLLLAGRAVHAWGISQPQEDFRFRVTGMSLTFTALAGGVLGILLLALLR